MASNKTTLGQQAINAAVSAKDQAKDAAIMTKDVAAGLAYNAADKAVDAKDKVVSSANSTWNSVSNAAGAAGHATAEKAHGVAEAYNQTLATSDTLDGKQRMEAAKSALEHHAAAKEHRFVKEEEYSQSGVTELSAKASSLASAAKENIIVASAVVADKTSPAVDAVRERASSTASYVADKTAPVVEAVRERASSTASYVQEKTGEAVAVAQENLRNSVELVKERANTTAHLIQEKTNEAGTTFKDTVTTAALTIQEKANNAANAVHMSENVESLKNKTLEISEDVSIGAQSTWYAVSAVAGVVGHATAEKTHSVAEAYNARQAISESLDPHSRIEAAKSALEHHALAKQHRDLKELNSVAAGIPEMKQRASEMVSSTVAAIPPALSSAASSAGQYAQAAGQYVASGATAVYSAALGAKENVDTTKDLTLKEDAIAKEKAINTGLPVSERMEAAKSVLEHELSARQQSAYIPSSGAASAQ